MAVEAEQREYAPKSKKPSEEEEKRRKKVTPGSLMKAVVRHGGGDEKPVDKDQVIYHCTIRTLEGVIVHCTKSEHGGKGYPIRQVLGKSNMILGLSEGIPTMLKGEVALFKMKPEIHYAEDDCPVRAPEDFPVDDELHFEIEMLEFSKAKARMRVHILHLIVAKAVSGKVILPQKAEPYCFTFGKSEVPKGLEMAVGTMTRGEKAVIFVSHSYLTGSPLMPMVEGVEEVEFEVELVHFVQVRDVLGDGRLIKRRVLDGRGEFPMDCPLHDSLLRVHYKAMLLDEEETIFYDTKVDNHGEPLEFSSGEGLVPEGLEMCIRLMLPGEVAVVTCPPDYAYDKFERPAEVPEGAYVKWEIELLGFEMPKDWTGLNFQSIMEEADKIKNTGNRLFKEGKYELAKAKYEKVLREYNHVNPQDDEQGKIFLNSRNSLHLNVAACLQKMGEYRKSIDVCNKVLDANPVHVKALYRRGTSYMLVGDFDEARKDFNKMISIDKSSEPDANAALLKLKQKEQEIEKMARKQFKGLFDRKPGEISEVETEPGESQASIEQNQEVGGLRQRKGAQVGRGGTLDFEEKKRGLFAGLWPSGRRIFTALGLNKCTIL
ncbi:uncharacterized protein A4U43_C07F990 [Asparagus officinalis]|uniref:peptidylprolyl isomerase n=1 Tax=Asparagus officinalis TaxID=4686 RepID=A0A5P1E8J1_ASPOF|nr:uncharacterized protein A4U43_C07F990 [Asparagus officinalis]